MSDAAKYFILLQKRTGKKRDRGFSSSIRPSRIDVLAGALLLLCEVHESRSSYVLVLETIENDREVIEVECIPGEVENIQDSALLDILRPIPVQVERLAVYLDREWVREGLEMHVNDPVMVKLKGHKKELPGVIRYKGPVTDVNGTYFGVQLTDGSRSGTCDGTFRKKRYFHCEPESGLFCAIHKIRRSYGGVAAQNLGAAAGSMGALMQPAQQQQCSLQRGIRVVCMFEFGPEHGTVKWIGTLPDDVMGETMVGVELDNKVGSGTGKYKDTRLFFAKQGHASLVPILGVKTEEEFLSQAWPKVLETGSEEEDLLDVLQAARMGPALPPSAPKPMCNNLLGAGAAAEAPPAVPAEPPREPTSVYHQLLRQYQQQAANLGSPNLPSTSSDVQNLPPSLNNPPLSYAEVITKGGLNPLNELTKSSDCHTIADETPEVLEFLLNCQICMEPFDQTLRIPRILPCYHAFCGPCITQLDRGGVLTCPNDRTEIAVSGPFPVDFTRASVVEHKDVLLRKGRASSPLEEACQKHQDEKLKFFCSTCKSALCSECAVIEHKNKVGHDIVRLGDVLEQVKGEVKSISTELDNIRQSSLQPRAKMAATSLQEMDASFQDAAKELHQGFGHLVTAIHDREEQAMEELRSKWKADRLTREKQVAATESHVNAAKTCTALGRTSMSVGLPNHIVAQRQELERAVQEARAEGGKPLLPSMQYKVNFDMSVVMDVLPHLGTVQAVPSARQSAPAASPRQPASKHQQ